ncbi:MAG: flagellar biosynthesis anti-sigma factor FlgM [Myxococcota bacterium]|nr:flagellar biosynthesis anti-sigma factor FlgM [Myxococcota bacterium]
MATKLSRKDVPAAWATYLSVGAKAASSGQGRRDSVERQRRIAQLRELVASGTYKVNLEHLAAALIRRGGLMHGGDAHAVN